MSFAVAWDPDAADDVELSWNAASAADHQLIFRALETLEDLLHDEPLQDGESRENLATRVVTCPPITAHFRVETGERLVRVFAAPFTGDERIDPP